MRPQRAPTSLLALLLLSTTLGACTSTAISPLARAHNAAGAELLAAGELERAEANFRLALEYAPGLPEARMNLGVLALQRDRPAIAERELRAAIGLREDFPEAWGNLGAALEASGRMADAEAAYERALSLHPGLAFARRNLGRLLLSAGRHAEARAHLLRLLESDPSDRTGHALLAWCELSLGRPDAAAERLAFAFAGDEDVPSVAHLVRAILAMREGALVEARDALELAAHDPALRREVTVRRAAIHVVLGEWSEATALLAPILEEDPYDAAAHLLMAEAARIGGELEVAREHAETALSLVPDLLAARSLLTELGDGPRASVDAPRAR